MIKTEEEIKDKWLELFTGGKLTWKTGEASITEVWQSAYQSGKEEERWKVWATVGIHLKLSPFIGRDQWKALSKWLDEIKTKYNLSEKVEGD